MPPEERRVAVKIAYLGKDFSGSQIQPGLRTVVGQIISDLEAISGGREREWFNIKTASRTDAGVNALENVVVFNTAIMDDCRLLRGLNAVSDGVFYRSIATVGDDFNPRFASYRTYRYLLPSKGIDIPKAKECSELFLGEHDFIRFCKLYDKATVMSIASIEIEEEGDILAMTFHSRYFLWNMIRKIVAAVASVGRGDSSAEDVQRALDGEDLSFGLARPDALTLTEVSYDDVVFEVPCDNILSKRVREELFLGDIRRDFFKSL